jgi:PBP1b-binding outer membrane lipoprotein LpoB
MRASILLLAALLAGCATTAPEPPVVVTDTFCVSPASKKRVWNPETDSVQSMREAVTHNRFVDLRCRAGAVKG